MSYIEREPDENEGWQTIGSRGRSIEQLRDERDALADALGRVDQQLAGAVEALRDLVEFVESIDGKADDFGELIVVAKAKAVIAVAGAVEQ